uniref:Uncharacterized protein n=1 Tax=Glossina palpalis gambiensis TaxID=67801 RepID=A0A1B0BZX6_9MUSC
MYIYFYIFTIIMYKYYYNGVGLQESQPFKTIGNAAITVPQRWRGEPSQEADINYHLFDI